MSANIIRQFPKRGKFDDMKAWITITIALYGCGVEQEFQCVGGENILVDHDVFMQSKEANTSIICGNSIYVDADALVVTPMVYYTDPIGVRLGVAEPGEGRLFDLRILHDYAKYSVNPGTLVLHVNGRPPMRYVFE
jgi:hypothetical protein